jgi:hypothetical protein
MSLVSKYFLLIIFLQALVVTGSGTFRSLFGLLAQPEPDENGVMISNYHGVQRKVYNPLISANGGLLYYRDLAPRTRGVERATFLETSEYQAIKIRHGNFDVQYMILNVMIGRI